MMKREYKTHNRAKIKEFLKENCDRSVTVREIDEQGCDAHLHLQCVSCGAVIHLNCSFMEEIADHISQEHDFSLQCRGSVIYGLCSKCRPEQRAHRQAAGRDGCKK